jgi:cysteine synthase
LAAIGVLAVMLVRPDTNAGAYRALGAAQRAAGDAVVVFQPDTTEREMRRILQASGARVVDGPTVTSAYVIALPETQAPAALAHLRAEPAITLAQPLGAAGRP